MTTYEAIALLLQALTTFGVIALLFIYRPTLKAANGLLKLFDFDKIDKMVEVEKRVVRAEEKEAARKEIDGIVAKLQESERRQKLTTAQAAQKRKDLLAFAMSLIVTIPPEARERFISNSKLDRELKDFWSRTLPTIQHLYYPELPALTATEVTLSSMMKVFVKGRPHPNLLSVSVEPVMPMDNAGDAPRTHAEKTRMNVAPLTEKKKE